MSRYDLTPKQAPFDSIVIGWDDLSGFYARGYYETELHDESGEDWTLEQEVDFAGDPFNGLLEPDELIDTLGAYAEIPTDLRDQLLAVDKKWLADRFDLQKGRAFSVEREPHVVDEKEPGIRLQSRATSASLPIEVKVAESWTLTELEEAVTKQLAGRYLRERDQRHGILILAHQKARPKGWEDETGTFLNFGDVVERLQKLAYELGAGGQNAARVEIKTIDVSGVETV